MSREKDLDDISFIVIEFPKRKQLISLCIRRIQYEEQWKRRLWKATELKTFPSWFSSLKLAGAKCQFEMKETTRRIKTGSVMAKT